MTYSYLFLKNLKYLFINYNTFINLTKQNMLEKIFIKNIISIPFLKINYILLSIVIVKYDEY